MITDHLSHLATLYVAPKLLQTLPVPKMGLPGGHGQGNGVLAPPKAVQGMITDHLSHLSAL